MLKPGRNSTSWQPAWNHGKTQSLRVPIALADQILDYARAVDSGLFMDQHLILRAIDFFVEERIAEFHPNQYSNTGSITSRRWDELRRFRNAVASGIHPRTELTFESQPATARH